MTHFPVYTPPVIVDVYDDPELSLLKLSNNPVDAGLQKLAGASLLPEDQLQTVPDHLWALVARVQTPGGPQVMRKYACYDLDSTVLSATYFVNRWESLPTGLAKVAGINLETALGWYDIDAPQQLQEINNKLAGLDWGPVVVDRQELEKRAQQGSLCPGVVLTTDWSRAPTTYEVVATKLAVANSVGIDDFEKTAASIDVDTPEGISRAARHYQVVSAGMDPFEKIGFARALVSRARQVGAEQRLPAGLVKTAGYRLGGPDDIIMGIADRRRALDADQFFAYTDVVREKLAGLDYNDPDDDLEVGRKVAEVIRQADEQFGLVGKQLVPSHEVAMVQAHDKVAGYSWAVPGSSGRLSGRELVAGVRGCVDKLASTFSDQVVAGLLRQPVEYFDALDDQMKLAVYHLLKEDQ